MNVDYITDYSRVLGQNLAGASLCYVRYGRTELSFHQSTLWNSLIDRYQERVGVVSYIHQALDLTRFARIILFLILYIQGRT